MTDLTPRQRQVLDARAAGETHRQIAERLGCSIRAVASHQHRALAKLGTTRLIIGIRRFRKQEREDIIRATT